MMSATAVQLASGGDADIQIGTWQWHPRTRAFSLDPRWCEAMGIEACAAAGTLEDWVQRIHPDDVAEFRRKCDSLRLGQVERFEIEYRVFAGGARWVWLLHRARTLDKGSDGLPLRVAGICLEIDDRKRAEVALHENEARLATALRELHSTQARLETAVWGAGMGLWELDFRRAQVRWYSDWCERLELHPCDGQHHVADWDANIHPDDVGAATERFSDHLAGKADYYDAEYRIRDKKGHWRWLFERGRIVERDSNGAASRMVGVCMDIKERKEAELESVRSQRRLEAALQSVRGGMWDWDLARNEVRRTEHYYRILGLDPNPSNGTYDFWNDRVHPEDRPRIGAAVDAVIEGREEIYESEYRLRHEDGSWRWVLDRGRVPERDAEGRATRMLGFIVDVTERNRAENALRESQMTLETQARILETMREGVVLIDSSTHLIALTNATFDKMFGYESQELMGHSIDPLFSMPALQRKRFERTLRDNSESGAVMPVEFECSRKDGSRFVATCVATPLRMSGTERWLAVLNDVTERKRLEREIIEISNREQQRIGSDLHDGLGQDLTGIALMLRGVAAQLRKEGSAARLDVEEVIGLVNNAIESTRALARGLSPVGGERGGLAAALQTLAARASERYGVHVEFNSNFVEPLRLSETAATHVYRIVQEALTNVIRHARATEVAISLETVGGELHLRVDDNGRGFEHPSPDRPGGLGLKIMRYRAQMMGGDLILESGTNGGASIRCSCPLDTPRPATRAAH